MRTKPCLRNVVQIDLNSSSWPRDAQTGYTLGFTRDGRAGFPDSGRRS